MEDVMRSEYRELADFEKRQMAEVKKRGNYFIEYLRTLDSSAANDLAQVKLEEAVMWAVKGITG